MIDTVYANCGGRLLGESELNRGDVLFYKCDDRESGHVAIYLGNGERVHSDGSSVTRDDRAFNSSFIGGGPLVLDAVDSGKNNTTTNSYNSEDKDTEEEEEDNEGLLHKGALDLEKTGLTKDALRFMILASYVTQATSDTLVGIEIPKSELSQEVFNKFENTAETHNNNRTFKTVEHDRFHYYAIKNDDGSYSYYQTENGVVQIVDANGDKLDCYNSENFIKNIELNQENGKSWTKSYESNMFYTVPEIGKIQIMTVDSVNDEYTFSTSVMNYAKEPEIEQSMIPMELLVDFLNISASTDYMTAFEELVKDQEIIIKVVPHKVTTEVETNTSQDAEASAVVGGKANYFTDGSSVEVQTSTTSNNSRTEAINQIIDPSEITLSPQTITTHDYTITVNLTYKMILEKADTWFMKAHREVKEYTNVNGPKTETYPIQGAGINGADGTSALYNYEIPEDYVANWEAELTNTSILNKLGRSSIVGSDGIRYYANEDYSNMQVYSSSITLHEGTKEVITTITTESYSKGLMKYEDNYEGFLGLWANPSGKYHKYRNDGVINKQALFKKDKKNKKVGYADLYGDKNAYVGDNFVNADKMLFELLEMSENTQNTSYIMRYMLSIYTAEDYGVTDFNTLLRLLGILTISTGDYNMNCAPGAGGERLKIVETEDGNTATQNLINGIKNIANPSYREKCMVFVQYADFLIELQEKYGVNPSWLIAQSYLETQCGTVEVGSALLNNWYGLGYDGNTYNSYSSPKECFEDVCDTYRNGDYYFRDNKETIMPLSYTWVKGPAGYDPNNMDPDWEYVSTGKEIVHDILIGAGVKIGASDVVEFALQFEGMTQVQIPGFLGHTMSDNSFTVFQADWCAMFASWCFDQCGLVPSKLTAGNTCADDLGRIAISNRTYRENNGTYTPNPGDLIFFDWNPEANDWIDHVAIVESVNGNSVTWIGGNQGGGGFTASRVTKNSASLSSINITGYWDMSN